MVKTKENQAERSMILLDRAAKRVAAFAGLHPQIVSSVSDLRNSVAHATKDSVWVRYASDLTAALVKHASPVPSTLGMTCGCDGDRALIPPDRRRMRERLDFVTTANPPQQLGVFESLVTKDAAERLGKSDGAVRVPQARRRSKLQELRSDSG